MSIKPYAVEPFKPIEPAKVDHQNLKIVMPVPHRPTPYQLFADLDTQKNNRTLKSTPLPIDLCSEATDIQTPIGWICFKSVFECIPPEWLLKHVNRWPTPPLSWGDDLKKALLNSSKEKLYLSRLEDSLNDETLGAMISIAYRNILNLVSYCAPNFRSLLAAKKPFDHFNIIRENIEHNLCLEEHKLAELLAPFVRLFNETPTTKEELYTIILFTKAFRDYQMKEFKYRINKSDLLQIFFLQMSTDIDSNTLKEFLVECKRPEAISKLDAIGSGKASLPQDDSPLSRFINTLYDFTSCIGEEALPLFLAHIIDAIKHYQNDTRREEMRKVHNQLWSKCGAALFGINPCLERFPMHKEIYKTLDSLPLLTSYEKVLSILIDKHFPNHRNSTGFHLASILYKSWWFGEFRRGKKISLAERLVDWLMYNCLVSESNWGLDEKGAVQVVKDEFYKASILPFNPQRAQIMYFRLHYQRRKLEEAKKS
ncbi:MAG: hypothetical protein JJU12_07975 [Chlamydiales bacterium]|nr:hypothetical protein [Chlamydiales bacterium]